MITESYNFLISFIIGLTTPGVIALVLPLYPRFLSTLSSRLSDKDSEKIHIMIGLLITLGTLISMLIFGLIFTYLFNKPLLKATDTVRPIAFVILSVLSIILIIDYDLEKVFPKISAPIYKNPLWTAFIVGFFYGSLVLPLSPTSLTILIALSSTTTSFVMNVFNFISFGLGISTYFLIFSILPTNKSRKVIDWFIKNQKYINRTLGVIMLLISLYSLFFIFKIHESII